MCEVPINDNYFIWILYVPPPGGRGGGSSDDPDLTTTPPSALQMEKISYELYI